MFLKFIFLGYMGSGKTFIGKELSKFLKIPFYDLDFLIMKYENNTIDNIFAEKGENNFRIIENFILKNFLEKNKSSYILSVGGGTPCYYNNINIMNNYALTIYLKASKIKLFNRLNIEKMNRPIIKNFNDKDLLDFISNHLSEREYFYLKAKKYINICTPIKEIIYNIIK